jgi:hypothetical protein
MQGNIEETSNQEKQTVESHFQQNHGEFHQRVCALCMMYYVYLAISAGAEICTEHDCLNESFSSMKLKTSEPKLRLV